MKKVGSLKSTGCHLRIGFRESLVQDLVYLTTIYLSHTSTYTSPKAICCDSNNYVRIAYSKSVNLSVSSQCLVYTRVRWDAGALSYCPCLNVALYLVPLVRVGLNLCSMFVLVATIK